MEPVERLVDLFGGLRECARKLGERHHSTVQTWLKSQSIPHWREAQIRSAAEKHGIKVPASLWRELFPNRAEAA